jgi:hypothetical protein
MQTWEHPEHWTFDGEQLLVYFEYHNFKEYMKIRVTRIESLETGDIPADSPLYEKASRRFERSYDNGLLVFGHLKVVK